MTLCFWWKGQPERAVESGQRAISIAQELGDRAIEAFGRHLARVEAEPPPA